MVAFFTPIWRQVKDPLGFTRPKPPDPTTIRRTLNDLKPEQLQQAFEHWIQGLTNGEDFLASVDGKAMKNVLITQEVYFSADFSSNQKVMPPRFTKDALYSFQLRVQYLSFFLDVMSSLMFFCCKKNYRLETLRGRRSSPVAIYATTPQKMSSL